MKTRMIVIGTLALSLSATAGFAQEPARIIRGNLNSQPVENQTARTTQPKAYPIHVGGSVRRSTLIKHNYDESIVKVYIVHTPVYIHVNSDLQHQGHGEIDRNHTLIKAQNLARYLNSRAHVVRNEAAAEQQVMVQAPQPLMKFEVPQPTGGIVEAPPAADDNQNTEVKHTNCTQVETQPVDREVTLDDVALASCEDGE